MLRVLLIFVGLLLLSNVAPTVGPSSLSGMPNPSVGRLHGPDLLSAAASSLESGKGPAGGRPWSCPSSQLEPNLVRCSAPGTTPNARPLPGWNGSVGLFEYSVAGAGGMVEDFADHYVLLFDDANTWTFSNGTWTYLVEHTAPTARCGFGMAYDALDHYVVLFGGNAARLGGFGVCSKGAINNQTWEFNAGVWTRLSPLDSPPSQTAEPMAYDSADRAVVLLDSQYTGPGTCDTWLFARGDWSNVCPANPPGPRAYAAMKFDPSVGSIVLFGGFGCPTPSCTTNTYLNETWTFKGGNWTLLHPASSPPPQRSMAAVYDGLDNYLLILGGENRYAQHGPGLGWFFANGSWKNLTLTVSSYHSNPYEGIYGDVCFDASTRAVMFVINGDLWTYKSGNWSLNDSSSAVTQPSALMSYDWADHYVLLLDDGATWSFSGNEWSEVNTGTNYPTSGAQSMTFDSADGYVLLYVRAIINNTALSQTWTYRNGSWSMLHVQSGPSARTSPGLVFDDSDGYVILLGGSCSHALCGDMWNFSMGRWLNISSQLNGSMPARYAPDLANDSAVHGVVLFGGEGAARALTDTWIYSRGAWTFVKSAKSPGTYASQARLVGDPALGFPLLIGSAGYSSQALAWNLTNGTWKSFAVSSTSGPVWSPLVAYDAGSGSVILTTPNLEWSLGLHEKYPITFRGIGLPAGSSWTARFSSFTSNATVGVTGSVITPRITNGTYFLTIVSPAGFSVLRAPAMFVVDGKAFTVTIQFAVLYRVTLRESGLAAGTQWAVDFNGFTLSGNVSTITFYAPNGSYGYFVGTAGGLSPNPGAGVLRVSGTAVLRPVKFS